MPEKFFEKIEKLEGVEPEEEITIESIREVLFLEEKTKLYLKTISLLI